MSAVVITAVERELARWESQERLAQRPVTDLGAEAATLLEEERSLRERETGVSRYVVVASVAVEYLLRTPLGLAVADIIEDASLTAPELMDAEVLSVLRRAVLNGRLEEARAQMVIDDLLQWPVDRISHRSLAHLAWQRYQQISA